GMDRAADCVAAEFKKAGLKPGVGGGYFQPFPLGAAVLEGKPRLSLTGPDGKVVELKDGVDFRAMGMGSGGKVKGAGAVFAGYGVSGQAAPKQKYDDYAGVEVKGKVVVVLRDIPRTGRKDAPHRLRMLAGLTHKLAVAAKRGACAVLVVNDASMAPGDELLDFNYS